MDLKKNIKIKFANLKTELMHVKSGSKTQGNTKSVYDSPIKSLVWLINKIRKESLSIKIFMFLPGQP